MAKKQTAERTRGSNAALKDDYELNGVIDAAVSLHGRPVGRHKLDGMSGTQMRRRARKSGLTRCPPRHMPVAKRIMSHLSERFGGWGRGFLTGYSAVAVWQ